MRGLLRRWLDDCGRSLGLAHPAEEPAQQEEKQIERDANREQDRQDVEDEVDQEVNKALPEIDEVLDGVASHTLRLPTSHLEPSLIHDVLLFFHHIYDRIRRIRIHFGRMSSMVP